MIDDEQLAAWLKLAEEATPGPWFVDVWPKGNGVPVASIGADLKGECQGIFASTDDPRTAPHDAAFIAASREAVPLLVEEVRRLRRLFFREYGEATMEIERLREEVGRLREENKSIKEWAMQTGTTVYVREGE